MKTLPTERLARVIADGTEALTAASHLRKVIENILKDWGVMGQEAIIAELREALDANPLPSAFNLAEQTAYLKLNSRRLNQSRNRQRTLRGLETRDYLPEDEIALAEPSVVSRPILTLEEIEEKLKELPTI